MSPTQTAQQAISTVTRPVSERVAIARVLCIFVMTFVHVQPGIAENVYDRDAGFFDIVYFTLSRLVGLSAVSLLGIVSGAFIVSSLMKAGAANVAKSKLRTLVVPLVSWNLLMLALLTGYGMLSGNWQDMPEATPMGVTNAIFAITEWPVVVPLWFLRDLFVCTLLSPILLFGLRRSVIAVFALLIVYTLFGSDLPLLQRPQLLLFFALGMWIRLSGMKEEVIDKVTKPLLIGLVVMVGIFLTIRIERVLLGEMDESLRTLLDTLLRITMAAGFWQLTALVRRSAISTFVQKLEPYAFFLFCSHAIVFTFGGILMRRVFGNYGSDLFAVSFFLQPLIAVVAAIIGLQIISRLPVLPFLLNAGRRVTEPLFSTSGDRSLKPSMKEGR